MKKLLNGNFHPLIGHFAYFLNKKERSLKRFGYFLNFFGHKLLHFLKKKKVFTVFWTKIT